MSELSKLMWVVALVVSVPFSLIAYNLYTNAKNRELYVECLRTMVKMQADNPKSTTGLYCSLR